MADKFLNTGGSGQANISNGTANIYAAKLAAANLDPSRPIKTNAVRELVSQNLDIADVNNLQATLDNLISNPFAGTLQVSDLETDDTSSLNNELQKISNITSATQVSPFITDFQGEIHVSKIKSATHNTELEFEEKGAASLTADGTITLEAPVLLVKGVTVMDNRLYVSSTTSNNNQINIFDVNTPRDTAICFVRGSGSDGDKWKIGGFGTNNETEFITNTDDIKFSSGNINTLTLKNNGDVVLPQLNNSINSILKLSDNNGKISSSGVGIDGSNNLIATGDITSINGDVSCNDANILGTIDAPNYQEGGQACKLIRTPNNTTFTTSYNMAIGYNALASIGSTGQAISNCCIGVRAGESITNANNNVIIGGIAGQYITGNTNIAIGRLAVQGSVGLNTGSNNVGIGNESLLGITSGINNNCLGGRSGLSTTSGNLNAYFGTDAGRLYNNTRCTCIGPDADTSSNGLNRTSIGSHAISDADNEVVLGDINVDVIRNSGDGVCDLGRADKRFKDLYLSGEIKSSQLVEINDDIKQLQEYVPTRILSTRNPTQNGLVYEDSYIQLRFGNTANQLRYLIKTNPTGGWVCGGQRACLTSGNVITTTGRFTNITNNFYFFAPNGARNISYDLRNTGASADYWLMSEQDANYPVYRISLYMADLNTQYKVIVEVN